MVNIIIVQYILFCLCYLLIEQINATEHYKRTKATFDFYKDNIRCDLNGASVLVAKKILSGRDK